MNVDSVNEAGLRIDSGGGAIMLGKVKASIAACDTQGGLAAWLYANHSSNKLSGLSTAQHMAVN